ncbi:hypothetical protein LXA43DRAFT_1123434 [Ganoderma leucocontextum]|nr:hypothetical protein LXA43DRAFT_1123434 [Ganoderma leucocontextum]
MDTPSTAAAALKLEIERLTGVINQRKTGGPPPRRTYPAASTYPRNNVYVNPDYKPPSRTLRPPVSATVPKPQPASKPPVSTTQEARDVIIGGVAFESSGRSLVRKDLPKPTPKPPSTNSAGPSTAPHPGFTRNKAGTFMSGPRPYKPKTSRRGRPMNRNMTLNNTQRPYQSVYPRLNPKRKYSDKPCPRFSTTGTCNRGLTCFYQHDPNKVAICWPFLQDKCTNTAETCPLSHDPTPERTPLCVHFANNGRCNRPNCPFPHVRVGQREGICRDFAVLGYCAKGLECDQQHVRECPDFAEKGSCTTLGCKLPHVIRANRNRKAAAPSSAPGPAIGSPSGTATSAGSEAAAGSDSASSSRQVTAEDAQLGDEFISLTFHESESEEDDGEEDDGVDDGEEGQESPSEADIDGK